MKEAWLIIYIDPQNYEASTTIVYDEPSSMYLYDVEYEVKHIVYSEIE